MDHNMVLSYDYSTQIRQQLQTNAPLSRAILMAMAVSVISSFTNYPKYTCTYDSR